MSSSLARLAARLPAETDPPADGVSDIRPRFDVFPFMDDLKELAGGSMGAALVITVVLLVCCAIAWGAGRFLGAGKVQSFGFGGVLVCAAVAMIIGFAGGFTDWWSSFGAGWWG